MSKIRDNKSEHMEPISEQDLCHINGGHYTLALSGYANKLRFRKPPTQIEFTPVHEAFYRVTINPGGGTGRLRSKIKKT